MGIEIDPVCFSALEHRLAPRRLLEGHEHQRDDEKPYSQPFGVLVEVVLFGLVRSWDHRLLILVDVEEPLPRQASRAIPRAGKERPTPSIRR